MSSNEAKTTNSGWIGVDLDGTLAHYDEFRGLGHIGAPIPLMVGRVKKWLDDGRDVRIMTARGSKEDAAVARAPIEKWLKEHVGRVLPITCAKDRHMDELWDDRAVQVRRNTGERADGKK